jgi:CRP/FNR family transcriptional regulator
MSPDLVERLVTVYPAIKAIAESERSQVLQHGAQFAAVAAGTLLFDEGTPCQGFPLILSGEVRVARGNPAGLQLELYRVTPGELCVVSTSCLFGHTALTAHGQTSEPTELALLTPAGFDRWCETPAFRRFVFGVFADRLADLMALTEAVAFQRLDQRLASLLLGHGSSLHRTHQQLADELGTVREIVSRLLARFERAGWVRLGRERVDLLDAAALRQLASGRTESA